MARAFLFVLDSFGIGGAPDAEAYGDLGSNTLGHIAGHCSKGLGDKAGLRSGALRLPNLDAAGLGAAAVLASGNAAAGLAGTARTHLPAIGKLQACPSRSTGAIFRRQFRPSQRH